MEDPFEKPLSTGDEHLRWPLADVAPEMLEVSVVAVRAQSRSPSRAWSRRPPARTQPGFSDDSQTGNDSSRAPDRPSSPVPLTSRFLPPPFASQSADEAIRAPGAHVAVTLAREQERAMALDGDVSLRPSQRRHSPVPMWVPPAWRLASPVMADWRRFRCWRIQIEDAITDNRLLIVGSQRKAKQRDGMHWQLV